MISVATSADSKIDDCSSERLILSTPEDWEEVYALRSEADALIIGAETLRRDNPRLRLKSELLREKRLRRGVAAEPLKVVVSRCGYIDPALRLFEGGAEGADRVVIFSQIPRPELEAVAQIIVQQHITPHSIITALEQRGAFEILVEGGEQILSLFLRCGAVDRVRLAVRPTIVVGESSAPHFDSALLGGATLCSSYNLGEMEVKNYTLRSIDLSAEVALLRRAIELSRSCQPSPTSYRVGAVVVTASGERFEGYTHQTSPTHHAEQEAILKADAAGAELRGATMYSSIEPCSTRSSEPQSCSEIIIERGFRRAVFALYEPSCFVTCHGALNMRCAGVEVLCIGSLADEVREINSHLNF